MEKSITIQSVRDATRLTLFQPTGDSFAAALASNGFSGRVFVSTYCAVPPSALFDGMAHDWRGWEGKKEWSALEDELTLTATSDRLGHISLVVAMGDYCSPADWRLLATLHLEAGQLDELASAVKELFPDEGGQTTD